MVKGLAYKGLPVTMVLPGLPFGPGDRNPTPTGSLIIRALNGKMKNFWDAGVCPVDVRDVAKGHVLAMDKGQIGESYILANLDANMPMKDFLRLIGDIADIPDIATKEVSAKLMLSVARAAEWWSKLTGRAPMTTYKNTMFSMQHCHVDPSKAIRELGLPQTPIETSIRDSIDWFKSNGYA